MSLTTGPGKCCYTGFKHEGTPSGELTTYAGYDAYVAYPENKATDKAVIFLSDVMGHKFPNSQLLADQYARAGFLTIIPDLFAGDVIEFNSLGSIDFPAWFRGDYSPSHTPHDEAHTDPVVNAVAQQLKADPNIKKVSAAGYCFGAKYVCRLLRDPEASGVSAGYVAHPSLLEREDFEKLKAPLAIGAAENDGAFPAEKRHEGEEILKKVGQPYQVNLYQGVGHGFGTKGDMSVRACRFAKESTFRQAVEWFDTFA